MGYEINPDDIPTDKLKEDYSEHANEAEIKKDYEVFVSEIDTQKKNRTRLNFIAGSMWGLGMGAIIANGLLDINNFYVYMGGMLTTISSPLIRNMGVTILDLDTTNKPIFDYLNKVNSKYGLEALLAFKAGKKN